MRADIVEAAERLLARLKERELRIATAESCTGGLIAAVLTEVPGCSHIFDHGIVAYSNEAKTQLLAVPQRLIARHGAVSSEVACAMAEGTLKRRRTDIAVAVTGIAGPDGGSAEKPVGLVYIAVARAGGDTLHRACRFGDIGRSNVRHETVAAALGLVDEALGAPARR